MRLIIHRGTHQIGGSCVAFQSQGHTLLIDMGLPLDFRFDREIHDQVPASLTSLLDGKGARIDAVLLSHAHLDHFGLAGILPPETLVYCGEASAELMLSDGEVLELE